MEKLTIEELAVYLPYKLMYIVNPKDVVENWVDRLDKKEMYITSIELVLKFGKPILKPLFAIPQSFVDASPYDTHDEFIDAVENHTIPYNMWFLCIKYHFDVFGLIDRGLAIDINTLTHED